MSSISILSEINIFLFHRVIFCNLTHDSIILSINEQVGSTVDVIIMLALYCRDVIQTKVGIRKMATFLLASTIYYSLL